MSKKTGNFWHFFPILTVFRSLCLSGAILAHQTSNGMFSRSWRIFWHPWDPWGRIHIDLNKNSVCTDCVYQFYPIIEALVSSSFANGKFRRISVSFQHHFKIYLLWLLHEKECSFYSYLFCCTEMTWMFIISSTIWVNGWDTSSVASRSRSELTSSQCNWKGNRKGKGTDETPPGQRWQFRKKDIHFWSIQRNCFVRALVVLQSSWRS